MRVFLCQVAFIDRAAIQSLVAKILCILLSHPLKIVVEAFLDVREYIFHDVILR